MRQQVGSDSTIGPPVSKAALKFYHHHVPRNAGVDVQRHDQLEFLQAAAAAATSSTVSSIVGSRHVGVGGQVESSDNGLEAEMQAPQSVRRARRTITKGAVGSARRRPTAPSPSRASHTAQSFLNQQRAGAAGQQLLVG